MKTLLIITVVIVTIMSYSLWGFRAYLSFFSLFGLNEVFFILTKTEKLIKPLGNCPRWIRNSIQGIFLMIIGIIQILIICLFYIPILNWVLYKLIKEINELKIKKKNKWICYLKIIYFPCFRRVTAVFRGNSACCYLVTTVYIWHLLNTWHI